MRSGDEITMRKSIRGQNHRALLREIVDQGGGLECNPLIACRTEARRETGSYGHVTPVKVAWRTRPLNPLVASKLNGADRYRRCCTHVAAVRFSCHFSLNLQGSFSTEKRVDGPARCNRQRGADKCRCFDEVGGLKDPGFAVGCRNSSISALPVSHSQACPVSIWSTNFSMEAQDSRSKIIKRRRISNAGRMKASKPFCMLLRLSCVSNIGHLPMNERRKMSGASRQTVR